MNFTDVSFAIAMVGSVAILFTRSEQYAYLRKFILTVCVAMAVVWVVIAVVALA